MKQQGAPQLTGIEHYNGLTKDRLEDIIHGISQMRAGVIGDICLDAYWHADMTMSELSRETPHYPLPVIREIYSPGAGGNVAANMKALGCTTVYYCSVIGNDWRGDMLRKCMSEGGVDDSFSTVEENWLTPAYCKPIRYGMQGLFQEDPRLDFHNHSPLTELGSDRLVTALDRMAQAVDVIAVTDQFSYGVIGPKVRERLAYWGRQGKHIVVDSRNRIGSFAGTVVKPNEIEGLRWYKPDDNVKTGTWGDWLEAARQLSAAVDAPCCMTLGENGSLWVEGDQAVWSSAEPSFPPLDIVGAGDCFASALVCALGTGCKGPEAMAFAHLASSVVIHKIGMTGTASPEEIWQRFNSRFL